MRKAEHCERTDSEKIAFAPRETATILVWCGTDISAARSKLTVRVYCTSTIPPAAAAAEHAPKEL